MTSENGFRSTTHVIVTKDVRNNDDTVDMMSMERNLVQGKDETGSHLRRRRRKRRHRKRSLGMKFLTTTSLCIGDVVLNSVADNCVSCDDDYMAIAQVCIQVR